MPGSHALSRRSGAALDPTLTFPLKDWRGDQSTRGGRGVRGGKCAHVKWPAGQLWRAEGPLPLMWAALGVRARADLHRAAARRGAGAAGRAQVRAAPLNSIALHSVAQRCASVAPGLHSVAQRCTALRSWESPCRSERFDAGRRQARESCFQGLLEWPAVCLRYTGSRMTGWKP